MFCAPIRFLFTWEIYSGIFTWKSQKTANLLLLPKSVIWRPFGVIRPKEMHITNWRFWRPTRNPIVRHYTTAFVRLPVLLRSPQHSAIFHIILRKIRKIWQNRNPCIQLWTNITVTKYFPPFLPTSRNCFSSLSIVVVTSTTLPHTHPLLLRSVSSHLPWIGVWSKTSLLPLWWSACWPLLFSARRIFGVAFTEKVILMLNKGLTWRSELLLPHASDSGRMVAAFHSHDECDSLHSNSRATLEAMLFFYRWLKARQAGVDPHRLSFSLLAVAFFEKRAALPTSRIPHTLPLL